MKTKKINKKLSFSKETVVNLDRGQLKGVNGGGLTYPQHICFSDMGMCNSQLCFPTGPVNTCGPYQCPGTVVVQMC